MFQVNTGSKMCMNASCGSTSTVEWKRGWPLRSGALADLCFRCGSAYESSVFCETFHSDQSGWRECYLCNKRLHCGCIASKLVIEFMDYGGVGCATCTSCHQPNLRGESSGLFSSLPMNNRQHTNGEIGMSVDGVIRSQADLFSQPLVQGDDKREEFMPQRGFGNLMKPDNATTNVNRLDAGKTHESSSTPSSQPSLATLPYSLSFANAASQSHTLQRSTSGILQKPSKSVLGTPPGTISKSAQPRIGRPPVEGRGKSHLLPRYWPKYTDKELQQISGNLNLNIVPLFEKTLSASDAGRIGRLVLPKACAEAYFPPISQSEGIPLKIQDVRGTEWTFQFRFWPNNNSRMYVLEGVTACVQSMMLQAGDTVTFSRVDPGGKLIMGFRKATHTGDILGSGGLTNGASNEDTSSSGVTETPTSINASSCPSQTPPEELKGLPERLSSKKSEMNGGKSCDDDDDPSRVKVKKRTRTVGAKSKRLLWDSEESKEVRITWEETQELIRPSPSEEPSIVLIEEHEFEEFDLIPISYYDELPRHLPKTAILQGTGGCVWKVGMTLKQEEEEEEVYFEQGWPKFVKDNDLVDGDFMTFVYNGDNLFEVSIYGLDGCKQARAVAEEEEEEEDSICALSSDDTEEDTSAESEKANITVQRSNDKGKAKVGAVDDSDDEEEEDSVYSLNNIKDTADTGSSSEFEMANTILRSKNKGKSKEEVIKEESDGKEDSDHSLNSEDKETDTGSESKMAKNKGKKKKKVVESSDSDYAEEIGRLDLEEDSSSSDSSYAPDSEDTATHVKRKVTSPKKKGKKYIHHFDHFV